MGGPSVAPSGARLNQRNGIMASFHQAQGPIIRLGLRLVKGQNMKRTTYHREWAKKHPGYKAADSRRRALFRPAKRAFYRQILGVKARVNLLATFQMAR